MKISVLFFWVLIAAQFGVSTPADAQMGPLHGSAGHEVGIFLDAAGTVSTGVGLDFVPFQFYVVGFELDGQVKGYEFSLQAPPSLTVMSLGLAGPAPLNVSDHPNVVVGTGGCIDGLGSIVLVTYQAGFFAPGTGNSGDITLCLGPASPSSFTPAAPGYLQCDNTLSPFTLRQNGCGVYPNGCMVLNPTVDIGVLPVEASTMGAVKGYYRSH